MRIKLISIFFVLSVGLSSCIKDSIENSSYFESGEMIRREQISSEDLNNALLSVIENSEISKFIQDSIIDGELEIISMENLL